MAWSQVLPKITLNKEGSFKTLNVMNIVVGPAVTGSMIPPGFGPRPVKFIKTLPGPWREVTW